jgi:hypothetical protein
VLRDPAGHHPFIEGAGKLSSIIKSISLDPKTAHIAKRVPNFSKFVRECLLRWDAIQRSPDCPVERLGHPLTGDMCVPAPTRICLKHWPDGNPRMEDWREYRNMIEYDDFHLDRDRLLYAFPFLQDFECPQEWIAHRAQMSNHAQIEFDDLDIEGNAKPTTREKKSKIRRLWAVLWSRN